MIARKAIRIPSANKPKYDVSATLLRLFHQTILDLDRDMPAPATHLAAEQVNLAARFAEHGKKNAGPGPLALPFLFYNLEGTDREGFLMHFPWIVKKVLVPIIWRGKWKPMSPFLLV